MRALVTGGTGFIGIHLIAALAARGWRVRCLVRETSNRRPLAAHEQRRRQGDDPEADDGHPRMAGADGHAHDDREDDVGRVLRVANHGPKADDRQGAEHPPR